MEKDILAKRFYADAERYADLINGLGCGGERVVKKEDLEEADTQTNLWRLPLSSRVKTDKQSGMRDLVRKTAFGINFAVIGIENQETVDYAMPLRNMIYDSGEYGKQAAQIRREIRKKTKGLSRGEFLYGFTKESRLNPVVTFVLYYGDEWDGARNLYDIIDFTDIPEKIKKLVQNYYINVIEVKKIEDTSIFNTDIRQVFDFIRFSKNPSKLRELVERDASYQCMDEDAYDMAASYTKAENLIQAKKFHKNGGKINMCEALQALIEEGKEEGLEQGIKALIEVCREMGIAKVSTMEKIKSKFATSEENIERIMEKYWEE